MTAAEHLHYAPTLTRTQRHLDSALQGASVVEFDDRSRLVFFSDLHRGDNGPSDAFRPNRRIFLSALTHYDRNGYTYVEVGDGDELWKNRDLETVRSAHRPIYRVMEHLRRAGRLLVLVGNHQLVSHGKPPLDSTPEFREAVLLKHRDSPLRFLVTHGHQADGPLARAYGLLRPFVRHIWRHLQAHGLRTSLPEQDETCNALDPIRGALAWSRQNQARIEERIASWLTQADHLGIICGHTHRPAFAMAGGLPYYNTGSGVQPGYITGLEIADGAISLVSWTSQRQEGPGAHSLASGTARRIVLAGPQPLRSL